MDFSKFKTHDWLIVGGGIGMLIFGFVSWLKVDLGAFGSSSGGNAFDFFFTGTIPWILLVAAAVVTVLRIQGTLKDNLPWPLILLGATVLSALLLLIRIVFNPGIPDGIDRGIGMIVSFLAGIVAAVGGVMGFLASGGNFNDLKDPNKLKGAFGNSAGGGSGMAPPPPPPPPGV